MDPFDLRNWPGFQRAGGDPSNEAVVDQMTIDSRRIDSRNSLFVALPGEKLDGHDFVSHAAQTGVKFALVSKNWIPDSQLSGVTLLRVENPLRAFQEITKSYRLQLPTQIIGITGSFGKTMVKDLLHAFLNTEKQTAASPESFNSQIGVPLSLLTLRKEHAFAIIETAISEKSEMDFLVDMVRPNHTILTPFGKKHMASLKEVSVIAEEMMKLILATSQNGWSLIPNDPLLQSYSQKQVSATYYWNEAQATLPNASKINHEFVIPAPYQVLFPNQEKLQGYIRNGYAYFLNLINMATKAAWLAGISSKNISEVLTDYQIEPMRTEIWKNPHGTTFINDTYCSDPQSVDQALRHFSFASDGQRKTFVFGGMRGNSPHLENDYKRIGTALNKIKLDRLILFGEKPFKSLLEEMKNGSHPPEITHCHDPEEAFQYIKLSTHQQDLVLLKGEKKISLDHLTEMFNESQNNNQCTINFAAIQSNIATMRKKLPPQTRLMVIVKALAYGTDDVRMSKFLSTCGVDILGVSYVDEGIALKRAGVKQTIFAINAATYEKVKVVKWGLEVGVSDQELINALAEEAAKQQKKLSVHLHINTGMGRLGCRPEEALKLAQLIQSLPSLSLEGVMTHFSCADDPKEDAFTYTQIHLFDQAIAELKSHGIQTKWVHAANSAGVARFHLPQYNMVRIGLSAYGLYVSEAAQEALELRLALSLTSRIVGLTICKKGETVSYGRSYVVEREMQKIAVLPIGYFDGIHRQYSAKAYVLIRGCKAPMVGRICMDYMMVDVTDIPGATVGDKVLVFGEDEFGQYLSPEDLAASGNSIVHELITCLGPRIQRIFVYEEGKQIR